MYTKYIRSSPCKGYATAVTVVFFAPILEVVTLLYKLYHCHPSPKGGRGGGYESGSLAGVARLFSKVFHKNISMKRFLLVVSVSKCQNNSIPIIEYH